MYIKTVLVRPNIEILFFSTSIILLFVFITSINHHNSYTPLSLYIQNNNRPLPRVYCFILTVPKSFNTKARAINLTWAPCCDKYHFISEFTNDTKGLPIAPIANITPGYEHLIQKSTLAFLHIYDHYLNDYDWFMKADDDTYVFVDNLKIFLSKQNTSEPITFGYNFKVIVPKGFHSGGGGYVLSREAVKRFYQAHHDPNITCAKDKGAEDVQIAACLEKKGVYIGKSIDQYNRERFHLLPYVDHFRGAFQNWLKTFAENSLTSGVDCCSEGTISFHYVTAEHMYLIDRIHYGFRNKDRL